MPELTILRKCFAAAAIVFAFVAATMMPAFLHSPLPHATARFHAEPLGILLIAMRELIMIMPPLVALVNGIAWWKLTKNGPSARRWAMAACVSFLVLSLPFFVADLVVLPGTVAFIGVSLLALLLSSVGVTGIAVFGKYQALSNRNLSLKTWHPSVAAIRS